MVQALTEIANIMGGICSKIEARQDRQSISAQKSNLCSVAMRPKMNNLFALVFILIGMMIKADEFVFTENGQRILLKSDNTWELAPLPNAESSNFRKTSWGMTKDQVKATESLKVAFENNEAIGYDSSVNGLSSEVYYVFAKEKLVRGRYYFTNRHVNENDYIADFINLKKLLIQKYGQPTYEDQIWKNSLYKTDRDNWGMALKAGHMFYFATWQNENTEIYLHLGGDNFEISMSIDYTSKELGGLEEEQKTEQAKGDL
jgi:hypothetical protein